MSSEASNRQNKPVFDGNVKNITLALYKRFLQRDNLWLFMFIVFMNISVIVRYGIYYYINIAVFRYIIFIIISYIIILLAIYMFSRYTLSKRYDFISKALNTDDIEQIVRTVYRK